MARVFTDGAEMGDTRFWDYAGNFISAVTVPAPIGGEYSYYCHGTPAYRTITGLNEFYIRYRLRTSDVLDADGAYMLGFRHGSTNIARFSVDSIGRFCAYVGNSIVITSATVMQNDTWYLIEIHFKLDDNPNGIFTAYVDGTQVFDFSGDTKPGADTTIDNIYMYCNAYTTINTDDLALNDTTGGVDDGWCGDGIIMKITPNGNGSHNNWHGSDLDDVDNYLLVDEYPDDGDLTYVYIDGSSTGTQDQYEMTDPDLTNKIVLRIYPEARIRKTSAAAYTVKLGILADGGADEMSAARTLFVDDYNRIVGDEFTENPVDSNPWEEADLDLIEFIAEVG